MTQENNLTELEQRADLEAEQARVASLDQQCEEPVAWINEDELPSSYPYDDMHTFSKVMDGVRMFPVFWPETVITCGYLDGHADALEWAARIAEANHPLTGDWLYDDPHDLAKAIRRGPEMPTVDELPQGGAQTSSESPEARINTEAKGGAQLGEKDASSYQTLVDCEGIELASGEPFRFACCDCGLVHDVVIVANDDKPVGFAVKRNQQATSSRRGVNIYAYDQLDALKTAEAFNSDIPVTDEEEEEWRRREAKQ